MREPSAISNHEHKPAGPTYPRTEIVRVQHDSVGVVPQAHGTVSGARGDQTHGLRYVQTGDIAAVSVWAGQGSTEQSANGQPHHHHHPGANAAVSARTPP